MIERSLPIIMNGVASLNIKVWEGMACQFHDIYITDVVSTPVTYYRGGLFNTGVSDPTKAENLTEYDIAFSSEATFSCQFLSKISKSLYVQLLHRLWRHANVVDGLTTAKKTSVQILIFELC